jgi:quercetin dioxygenase-like cupin family protein
VTEPVFIDANSLPMENRAVDGRDVVNWRTLFSNDRTNTSGFVMGVADIPVDAHRPSRGHSHPQAETYVILSGLAEIRIDGHPPRMLGPNEAVHIPGGVEHIALNASDTESLRLLYMFAGVDSFDEVTYTFPPGA